jgi:hypothetical protein
MSAELLHPDDEIVNAESAAPERLGLGIIHRRALIVDSDGRLALAFKFAANGAGGWR